MRPGSKIGHFLAKCFHFFGRLLSLFLSLPLVPVNKIVEAFWHIRLHINEKARREATEEEKNHPDESQRKDDEFYVQEYKKEKERLTKKIDNNTSLGRSGFITSFGLLELHFFTIFCQYLFHYSEHGNYD